MKRDVCTRSSMVNASVTLNQMSDAATCALREVNPTEPDWRPAGSPLSVSQSRSAELLSGCTKVRHKL